MTVIIQYRSVLTQSALHKVILHQPLQPLRDHHPSCIPDIFILTLGKLCYPVIKRCQRKRMLWAMTEISQKPVECRWPLSLWCHISHLSQEVGDGRTFRKERTSSASQLHAGHPSTLIGCWPVVKGNQSGRDGLLAAGSGTLPKHSLRAAHEGGRKFPKY